MTFRTAKKALTLVTLSAFAFAQTPGGQVTNTTTYTYLDPDNYPDLLASATYSNWSWVDGAGATHLFPGYTSTRYKYIFHLDTAPTPTGKMDTSIISTSSDGKSILYATGEAYSINTPIYSGQPKYAVLGVIYAPPGAKSSVQYNTANAIGSSHTSSNSFTNDLNISATVGTGVNFGVVKAGVNTTITGDWKFSTTSSNTTSITSTTTAGQQYFGTGDGLNHDNDVIIVWLNPMFKYNGTNISNLNAKKTNEMIDINTDYATAQNNAGAGIPSNTMDILYIPVGQLRKGITDPSAIMAGNRAELNRPWSNTGALTVADYQDILSYNPFWNSQTTLDSNYNPINSPSIGYLNSLPGQAGRFSFVTSIPYEPNITNTGSDQYQYAQGSQETISNSWSLGVAYQGEASVWFGVQGYGQLKVQNTLSYSISNGTSKTATQTATASFSIAGPTTSTWAGPTNLYVYRDNLYGTYVYAFPPLP